MPSKKKNQNKSKNQNRSSIPNVRGQGGYYADNLLPLLRKAFPPGTFSNVGAAASGTIAKNLTGSNQVANYASKGGGYLGSRLAKIVGFGDYNVINNSLTQKGGAIPEGMEMPSFGNGNHSTVIRHREFIKDILVPTTPAAFNIQSFIINPGNKAMFPWLASIAARYQQYKVNGMIVEFKTMSSDITAGGALGTVVLATNYDVISSDYRDKVEMENSQYACSAKPSRSQIHAIECDPALTASKLLYIRDNSRSTEDYDARFYDLGKVFLATQGLPGTAGATLGELWVSYDITLYKPEIADSVGTGMQSVVGAGSVTKSDPFGTSPIFYGDQLLVTYPGANYDTLKLRFLGDYILIVNQEGVSVGSTVWPAGSPYIQPSLVSASIGTSPTTTIKTYIFAFTDPNNNILKFNLAGATSVAKFSIQLIGTNTLPYFKTWV